MKEKESRYEKDQKYKKREELLDQLLEYLESKEQEETYQRLEKRR